MVYVGTRVWDEGTMVYDGLGFNMDEFFDVGARVFEGQGFTL